MTIISDFLGSGIEIVPAGYCLLKLQVVTSDRQQMGGAVFSITATGFSQTATADESGRTEILVPSGATYTVALNYSQQTGKAYFNDEAQTVIAESATTKFVYFDLVDEDLSTLYTNLSASSWESDSTYEDFPYRCAIGIMGVTASDYAEVTFAQEQAQSGNYAAVCETYVGGVYIYSSVSTSITIPTILIHKG